MEKKKFGIGIYNAGTIGKIINAGVGTISGGAGGLRFESCRRRKIHYYICYPRQVT